MELGSINSPFTSTKVFLGAEIYSHFRLAIYVALAWLDWKWERKKKRKKERKWEEWVPFLSTTKATD